MTAPVVTYSVGGRASVVTLTRPEKLNAISHDLERQGP